MDDRERLMAPLTEYIEMFGQRRWYMHERYWERSNLAFVHARRRHADGVDEILVMSRLVKQAVRARRYVLLHGEEEWRMCSQTAFDGYLDKGLSGLRLGTSKPRQTICPCPLKVHRSGLRAQGYAEELARQHGMSGIQRPYRCPSNPRAFHLTIQQKGSRELIPDSHVERDPTVQEGDPPETGGGEEGS